MKFHPNIYLYGSEAPLPAVTPLRVGNLSADFQEGALRNIRVGDFMVLQRIYSAVRDHNWGTVPGTITILSHETTTEQVQMVFDSVHQQDEVDFVWRGTMTLTARSLTFAMEGIANSTFQRNRIGFCVLHDAGVAGAPLSIEHTDGKTTASIFPALIAPHQPFFNIRAIRHTPAPDVQAVVRMEGDTFEMEDQRNWTDASFKTYCTPLSMPFPVTVAAGTRIQQTISVTLEGDLPAPHTEKPVVTITPTTHHITPAALGIYYDGNPLTREQYTWLKRTGVTFLRFEVDMAHDDVTAKFELIRGVSTRLDMVIMLTVWFSEDPTAEISLFADLISGTFWGVSYIMVFQHGKTVTPPDLLERLGMVVPPMFDIIGGTNAFFTELNRATPLEAEEFTNNYTLTPQVHAFDNDSLVETLPIITETIKTANTFSQNELSIGHITLKMRWNPYATSASAPTPPDALPAHVDPRQMSLFCAAWTLGALKNALRDNVRFITLYNVVGMDGVMSGAAGSPLPDLFADVRGVYPVFHVLADTAMDGTSAISDSVSSHPRIADALYILSEGILRDVIVANFTPQPQTVILKNMVGKFKLRELNLSTVEHAIADPVKFSYTGTKVVGTGDMQIELPAYGVATFHYKGK